MVSRTSAPLIAFACSLALVGAPAAFAQEAGAETPVMAIETPAEPAFDETGPAFETAILTMPEAGPKPGDAVRAIEPLIGAPTPSSVASLADWVIGAGDNEDLPFVIIDKAAAVAVVYSPAGEVIGSTPVLIGSAIGDDPTPGVGERELRDVLPEDRTTHAGRFIGGYGPAADGREVLWVDFDTALSMHPVVTTNPVERRLERLNSETVDDNRITFGCINVPVAFYEGLVQPIFTQSNGVFYILPETRALAEVFPQYAATLPAEDTDPGELDLDALLASLRADSAG